MMITQETKNINFNTILSNSDPTLLPDFFLDESSPAEISQQIKDGGSKPAFDVASAAAPGGGSSSIDGTFATLNSMLSPDLVSSVKASYAFDLKGTFQYSSIVPEKKCNRFNVDNYI